MNTKKALALLNENRLEFTRLREEAKRIGDHETVVYAQSCLDSTLRAIDELERKKRR